MTKTDLIEALSEFPDDTMVVIRGIEGGCCPWIDIDLVKLKLNSNLGDNLGPHEVEDDGDTDAIYIY